MSMPTFEECMLPVLKSIALKNTASTPDTLEYTVKALNLSEEEKGEVLPNSGQRRIYTRICWARNNLFKAGLINRKKRGDYFITESGRDLLKQKPKALDNKFLYKNYSLFKEWIDSSKVRIKKQEPSLNSVSDEKLPPEERLEKHYAFLKDTVLNDLLDRIKELEPEIFEKLILKLLKKIGYGGADGKNVQHTGKSGDEGIDGEIKQDHLGLDRVYMQAKRYTDNIVGRPDIQKFVGALNSKKSKKGLFITTSKFSKEAEEYKEKIDSRLILIDGKELVELLYKNNIGVKTKDTLEYKEIDDNFFNDESPFNFGKVA